MTLIADIAKFLASQIIVYVKRIRCLDIAVIISPIARQSIEFRITLTLIIPVLLRHALCFTVGNHRIIAELVGICLRLYSRNINTFCVFSDRHKALSDRAFAGFPACDACLLQNPSHFSRQLSQNIAFLIPCA